MCSLTTMIKIALGIGLLLIIGYLALPQYHATFASLAPVLLVRRTFCVGSTAPFEGVRGMTDLDRLPDDLTSIEAKSTEY